MTEQELGRYFEGFIKTVLEHSSFKFDFEKKVKPKPSVLSYPISNEIRIKLRHRKNYYKPDFIVNNSTWIECTTKIKNAPKKELLYAHQCSRLIILYLYKSNLAIKPYFKKTTYLFIDDYLRQLDLLTIYGDDLKKLRSLTNEK